jgi:17beta-estradiol 17-dehydrogenase / very-long-chain 3-oxoacyl-CoA reductase
MNHLQSLFNSYPIPSSILLTLGSFHVLSTTCRISSFLYRKFLRPAKNILKTYGQSGSWAIITGASDGIGKIFCKSLAQRGFNICLIARNYDKTEAARKEIQEEFPGIKTELVIADFSKSIENLSEFYQRIVDDLNEKNINDIAILINNVGVGGTGHFEKMDYKNIANLISVNVYPTAFMTRVIVPKMIERPKKSLVISLSSMSAVSPFAYMSVYGATKKFNDQFSKALAVEFKGRIDFLSLKPGFVSTNMLKTQPGGLVITAEQCVEGCLRDVGWQRETAGYWKHDVVAWIVKEVLTKGMRLKKSNNMLANSEKRKASQIKVE